MIGCPDEAGIGIFVSAISCFGDSSMHRTGYRGSNGRLYTSNTISIFATKLLFCSSGITQPFCFQGLISVFLGYSVSFHEKYYQYIQARRPCRLTIFKTISQSLRVAHCNLMQSNELQNRRQLFYNI